MKIEEFINSFKEEDFVEQIDDLSGKLKTQREFKKYQDFEDVLDGVSERILHENIREQEVSTLHPKLYTPVSESPLLNSTPQ